MFEVLKINLTEEEKQIIKISRSDIKKYLGGKCLSIKMLLDYLKEGIDPLGSENILTIMGGPLSGTIAPSMKCAVATKSPLTNTITVGFMGGHIIKNIREAGFLGIMIEGKCKNPSYIYIEDEEVKIIEAPELWGLGTFETEEVLYRRHGRGSGIVSIGPAGENMVPFSVVNTDFYRQAARGGPGAVLGSKKIKAVVVKGTGEQNSLISDSFLEIVKSITSDLALKPGLSRFRKWGTTAAVMKSNEQSSLPTKNFNEEFFEKAENISGERGEALFWFKRRGCVSCPVGCGHIGRVCEGPFKGVIIEGPEYETAALIGSNLCIDDFSSLAYLNNRCDFWGLDTISSGAVLSFYSECVENSVLDDTLGLKGNIWGNVEAYQHLLELIAKKEGIGEILSLGVKKAAEVIGPKAQEYAMHVKGLEIPGWGPHRAPGMAVAYATADRGADHQQAFPLSYEIGSDLDKQSFEYIDNVAKIIIEHQNYNSMVNSIIGCDFTFGAIDFGKIIEMLKCVTGIEFLEEDLLKVGGLSVNLAKQFNEREGGEFVIGDIPERFFKKALSTGPNAGTFIDKLVYDKIKDRYLELRGWINN